MENLKTYIWNTEYEVLVSVSDTVEKARYQLYQKWYKNSMDYTDRSNGLSDEINLNRAKAIFSSCMEIFKVIEKEPDIVLNANEAVIYDHGNE